jgi:hypothetical protein
MSYIKSIRQKIGTELIQVPCVAALIRDSQNKLLFCSASAENGNQAIAASLVSEQLIAL